MDVAEMARGNGYVLRRYLDVGGVPVPGTFASWRCRHALAQAVTSLERPFYTYLGSMRRHSRVGVARASVRKPADRGPWVPGVTNVA